MTDFIPASSNVKERPLTAETGDQAKKRILVIEWTCLDGGLSELKEQGQAMLLAITEDFDSAGHQVVTLIHRSVAELAGPAEVILRNLESAETQLATIADSCDYLMLIAPESEGCLSQMLRWLDGQSNKLISPDPFIVELASSKRRTCDWLRNHSVPVPSGFEECRSQSTSDWIVKPDDGAGGLHMKLTKEAATAERQLSAGMRVEQFVAGEPVSVSVICGGNEPIFLPACNQVLSEECFGEYLGGAIVGDEFKQQRARNLAERAIAVLPPTRGWLGIDMVLSTDETEPRDVVIEINPRLTSSYLVLRASMEANLAQLILQTANSNSLQR